MNPKYNHPIPEAWVMAAQAIKKGVCYQDMCAEARAAFGSITEAESARRELNSRHLDRYWHMISKIAKKIPVRPDQRKIPFYLRGTHKHGVNIDGVKTFIPEQQYRQMSQPQKVYAPLETMQEKLFANRLRHLKQHLGGLVRWPDDISRAHSQLVVTKPTDTFHFKVTTGKQPNVLPTSHTSLALSVRAPLEFFNQSFYGFGEHLVVKILDAYYEGDLQILKTLSCDRANLYDLDAPNILKERWYVKSDKHTGTGLTRDAAIRSMQYYMGKELTLVLGG